MQDKEVKITCDDVETREWKEEIISLLSKAIYEFLKKRNLLKQTLEETKKFNL